VGHNASAEGISSNIELRSGELLLAIIHQIPDESIAVVNYLLELLVYILWDEDSNRRTKGEYESERLDGRIKG
jgi:hypothetical protein